MEPELVVDEPEPEPELELEPEPELEEDVPLDEPDVEEEVVVGLRLAELNVPLPAEEPLPAEPVGLRIGVTNVEFWPAGTFAAAD